MKKRADKRTAAEAADAEYLSFQYLCSVRTDTYHAYMAAYQFFKACDIALAVSRELVEACALGDILGKSREFLIDRLAALKLLQCGRELLDNAAVGLLVSYAHFECIYICESIQLVDSEAVKTVYSY